MLPALLGVVGEIGKKVAASLFPSEEQKVEREKAEMAFQAAVLERSSAIETAAANIVVAEAQGQSWLQRSWRPITMLTFVALIVARWLGWSAPELTTGEALKLWDIVELGLGGYVIGRSAEKILPKLSVLNGKK